MQFKLSVMKNLVWALWAIPMCLFANEPRIPSKIKAVTVYLCGAEITRTAVCSLKEGTNKVVFSGLSHKIDESSIQVSGLKAASILSMAYTINYLEKSESNPKMKEWQEALNDLDFQIALLKNEIYGLEEEEKVITTNRMVSTDNQALSLEKVKEISQYYRERITAIKTAVLKANIKISVLQEQHKALQNQMGEVYNSPKKEQGEIAITFDSPNATELSLNLKYWVKDAGWVPNYDIKSTGLNAPLQLVYKANVYQNTGQDWNDASIILSSGNPEYNISQPKLEAHYLNFTTAYAKTYAVAKEKQGYAFNPHVKKVVGTVTDATGQSLPGVNVIIKGTNKGTHTDFDGNYELDVPYGRELSFSYIGMHTQDVPLYASILNLSMEEDASQLDEVVVTGMGGSNGHSVMGYSVGAASALSGRVAGVQIRGAAATKNATIQNQQPHPLYIIDGVPVDGFIEGDLDTNEIENVTVLQGEEATRLYGNRAAAGVVLITSKKSRTKEGATKTEFVIKKTYSITSNNDITAIEINSFRLSATYEYFAAPVVDQNVFLTARFIDWEKHQLLPGEGNIYFEGTYAGKTVIDPYTTNKEMVISLGLDPNITVHRRQERNFKGKSFTGNNRTVNRTYHLEVKNNKGVAIALKLLDRIPKSENKDIKVDDMVYPNAEYDLKKGLLTWNLQLKPQETQTESFSFQVKYPMGRYISL
jgi:TonB-dependent SusC/RagA subfamily outer membrane receptor